ncbi:MAG: metallophosphoesterase family protein [Candidatus Aenigmarchaeota archaeon]|nr:metallophosphoesterase family protein [Candidatus Aenigmarchaeota archaeon]
MRYGFISDLHDHPEALEGIPWDKIDEVYCLGDLVEKDVNKARLIIDTLDTKGVKCVLGQHDRALFSERDLWDYYDRMKMESQPKRSMVNFQSANHLRENIGKRYIDWLRQWEERIMDISLEGKDFAIKAKIVHDCLTPLTVHESIQIGFEGKQKSRIITPYHAIKNFLADRDYDLLIHGHIHQPSFYYKRQGRSRYITHNDVTEGTKPIKILPGRRYIICPGSMSGDSGIKEILNSGNDFDDHVNQYSFLIIDTSRRGRYLSDTNGTMKFEFRFGLRKESYLTERLRK